MNNKFCLFTDVSSDPKSRRGMGASLRLPQNYLEIATDRLNKKEIIQNLRLKKFENTSSTQLEVETVLWSIENFLNQHKVTEELELNLYSDSQCVCGLLSRRENLTEKKFRNGKNEILKHAESYKKFYEYYDLLHFDVIKVTGHSPKGTHDTVHRIFSFIDNEVRQEMRKWNG